MIIMMPASVVINFTIILPLVCVLWLNRDAMKELVFLKLGGSLITDKTRPYTPLLDMMDDLALQIATTLQAQPNLRLVIGHGAGSFGHVAASEYKTRDGYPRPSPLAHRERDQNEENYWEGFAEVWYQASTLNRYVMKALHKANVRAISLPPSSSVIASEEKVHLRGATCRFEHFGHRLIRRFENARVGHAISMPANPPPRSARRRTGPLRVARSGVKPCADLARFDVDRMKE